MPSAALFVLLCAPRRAAYRRGQLLCRRAYNGPARLPLGLRVVLITRDAKGRVCAGRGGAAQVCAKVRAAGNGRTRRAGRLSPNGVARSGRRAEGLARSRVGLTDLGGRQVQGLPTGISGREMRCAGPADGAALPDLTQNGGAASV